MFFIFIGSLFFLSFFAGILFINFKSNKSKLTDPDLTQDQIQFQQIIQRILKEDPHYSDPPREFFRVTIKTVLTSRSYQLCHIIALILNIGNSVPLHS